MGIGCWVLGFRFLPTPSTQHLTPALGKTMSDTYQHINFREVERALAEGAAAREVVAVVFEAAEGSRAFSAGVSVEEHQPETIYQMLDSFHAIFRTMEQLSKPSIAIVDGA